MKVSVIVPVYNVEAYLNRCLESLVRQTLKELEVIIVNDGSPDNSDAIIRQYIAKYPNFKYYIKENGGLSDARNYGLKCATGEYIAFLDSDDYVKEEMYEEMYKKATSGNFDMVVCDIFYQYPDKIQVVRSGIKNDIHDKKGIKKAYYNIHPAAWNKLFKRELFNNGVEFKKGVWFEDVEFIYRLLPYVNSIGAIHEPFNQYVIREGSISNTVDKRIYDYIYNMNGVVSFYEKNNLYKEYKKELEYVYVRYVYATFIKSMTKYDPVEYMKGVEEAIKYVKIYFPKYRLNLHFYTSLKGLYFVFFNKLIAKIVYKARG